MMCSHFFQIVQHFSVKWSSVQIQQKYKCKYIGYSSNKMTSIVFVLQYFNRVLIQVKKRSISTYLGQVQWT